MDASKLARILVADPDADIRIWRGIEASALGTVVQVGSGQGLLDALGGRNGTPPDLLFLAERLSDMDGLEACRRLRTHPGLAAIPVLMMCVQPDEDFVRAALDAGASDVLQRPLNPDLLRARVLCYYSRDDRAQVKLLAAQARREELERTIEHMRGQIEDRDRTLSRAALVYGHDLATGLPNRSYLVEQLERALRRAENDRAPMALVAIQIGDLQGLHPGELPEAEIDRRMAAVAACIQRALRPLDLVARIGTARIAALLIPRELHSTQAVALNAREAVGRMRRALCEELQRDGNQPRPENLRTAVSIYPSDGHRASELLWHLEVALSGAGEWLEGRSAALPAHDSSSPLAMGRRLRRAIENHDLIPYYQPKVDVDSGRLIGAETLIRWPTAEGGFVGPGEFVPAAEASGLVPALDDYVLSAVCEQIANWQRRFSDFRIAVNLSAILLHQRGLLERMRELFEQTGARPEHLELEITESALITDFESARGWLGLARELGVKISLDDFGTGYSSLAYLKRLPLDAIKIDQSFVVGLEHEGSTVAIVRAMIAMARALGLTIVAEGIENTAQAAILARLGCSIVQGFLYSPAVPATAFERMLQSGRLDPRSERPSSVLGD